MFERSTQRSIYFHINEINYFVYLEYISLIIQRSILLELKTLVYVKFISTNCS